MTTAKHSKVAAENVIRPGKIYYVDATKYEAMKRAVLKALPKAKPGLTVSELGNRIRGHLPEALFPGGAKAGWWLKLVQLDLEAKGVIARIRSTPLRLHKT